MPRTRRNPVDAPRPLFLNVHPLARRKGITTPTELAARLNRRRQGLYAPWKGEVNQISLDMLSDLCRVLDARPGDWFRWEGEGETRQLVWNVQAIAQEIGMPPTTMAMKAGIHYQSGGAIYHGTQQSVFLDTLSRLHRALSSTGRRFDIGTIFVWDKAPKLPEETPKPAEPKADTPTSAGEAPEGAALALA